MKFKVGDRVRYVVKRDIDNIKVGEVGIIRGISSYGNYAVDFEESGYRHNCDGLCQSNHGWWCSGDTLEPVDDKTLRMAAESISHITDIPYENSINKLKACLSAFSNDGISAKNGGKNSMKFTFYFNVNEGTRIDKSCNGTIPTITTSVVLDKFGDPDRRKCYSLEGEATCDKADYDMRQGVLEALANAVFDGNFEKAYDKAVKTNAFCERQDRTCHYCGKVLDTIEEKQAHEAWHVERKKARRERYLLRKRAKEIAFEEAAQKLAKEMVEK